MGDDILLEWAIGGIVAKVYVSRSRCIDGIIATPSASDRFQEGKHHLGARHRMAALPRNWATGKNQLILSILVATAVPVAPNPTLNSEDAGLGGIQFPVGLAELFSSTCKFRVTWTPQLSMNVPLG